MNQENKRKFSDFMLPASILAAGILVSGSVIYSTISKNQEANDIVSDVEKTKIADPLKLEKDELVFGKSDAPVTVIVYSDPSCPFCAAAAGGNQQVIDYLRKKDPSWQPPIPGIIDDYVKSGKVKFIYRYAVGHGTGEDAMKLMLCANEQGKFWQLHDKVSSNQQFVEDLDKLREFAEEAGVDVGKINFCFMSGKYDSKIAKDLASAKALGINGTPAFFVNNIKLEGAQSFLEFKLVIDQELSKLE